MCDRFGIVCRLFGLTSGETRVRATFWLLDAPDSLEVQSHRNVDGAGLGYFGPDGELFVYFNNDWNAFAPRNAAWVTRRLGQLAGARRRARAPA